MSRGHRSGAAICTFLPVLMGLGFNVVCCYNTHQGLSNSYHLHSPSVGPAYKDICVCVFWQVLQEVLHVNQHCSIPQSPALAVSKEEASCLRRPTSALSKTHLAAYSVHFSYLEQNRSTLCTCGVWQAHLWLEMQRRTFPWFKCLPLPQKCKEKYQRTTFTGIFQKVNTFHGMCKVYHLAAGSRTTCETLFPYQSLLLTCMQRFDDVEKYAFNTNVYFICTIMQLSLSRCR